MSRVTNRPRLLIVVIALLGALVLTESVALAAVTLTRTGKAVTAVKSVASDASSLLPQKASSTCRACRCR